MKYYVDITLLPNPEIPLYFLWEKAYQQTHLALADIQENNVIKVGVSFPEYNAEKFYLGCKLRLFAMDKIDLERLNLNTYFSRLADYVHLTSIKEIPLDKITGYAFFKRIQPKSNNERLARRRAKRQGISYEQALAHYQDKTETHSHVPFIRIKSHSSGNSYPILIAREDTEVESINAGFSTYGLSGTYSVPVFD